jgi:parallel beta-helix repeat protein
MLLICNLPDICGPDFFNQFQGYGIIVDSAPGSILSNNYVSNNDVGIGVFGTSGCCIVDYNKLTDNRFFGIIVSEGEHTISNTKIFGGNVGVAAIASNADTVATLDHVKIIGATIPVQEIPSGGFTAEVVFLPN